MPELAVDLRKVGGAFSVDEGARRLIHYRYAEIACMEAEAGWVATLAAPKLKIRLAEHAYQCALHADAIGRRLPELRVIFIFVRVFITIKKPSPRCLSAQKKASLV